MKEWLRYNATRGRAFLDKIYRKLPRQGFADGRVSIPGIERLPDDELNRLNELLHWNSFIVDSTGRRFGNWTGPNKRNIPQKVPDPRILALNDWCPLEGKRVLEIGCFEGIHTVALASLADTVHAVDGRIEHLVKTMVRCGFFGVKNVDVSFWNVETAPNSLEISCDVLHHVGVLYHLSDPENHLRTIAPKVRDCIMLDTHVSAFENSEKDELVLHKEPGRSFPFAGLSANSIWLPEKRIILLLREQGFTRLKVVERRNERNGPRVLIFASREEE